MKGLFLSVVILSYFGDSLSQTGDDAKNLRTQLFVTDQYDKKTIPSTDQSLAKEVWVSFYLLNINGLDEVTETLTTTGYLWIAWYDDYLAWDPATYGGIDYYRWPQDDIWKPDITLRNSILDYKELGSSGLNVEVDYEGYVTWYPFQVFKSTCSVDITYFPFDVQTCKLTFIAWSYTKDVVFISSGSAGIDLDEYQESSLWTIQSSSYSEHDESSDSLITFTLKIKRKPLYFVLSIVMPIVLLAVLNVCVFVLPCESGERAGYAITVFLALAVFLTIISSSLPANSESVSIFSVYVILQTVQSTVITLVALMTIKLSSRETKIPRPLVALHGFVHCAMCMRVKRRRGTPTQTTKIVPGEDKNAITAFCLDVPDTEETHKPKRLAKPTKLNGNEANEDEDVEEPMESNEEVTWSMAVRAIDYTLFVVFFSIFSLSTIVCIVISAT